MDVAALQEVWDSIAVNMPLPQHIHTAWIQSLSEHGSPMALNQGDTIISVLDQDTDVGFLLLTGDYCVQKEGDPALIKSAPELLGEMAVLNPTGRRTARVSARSDVTLLEFRWSIVNKSLKDRLSDEDHDALKDALQQYAWDHFIERKDDSENLG